MASQFLRSTILPAALLVIALAIPCHASAATLIVTDFGDTGATGQLRALINIAAPGDTIVIPAGTITLITISSPVFEDANTDGDLDIHKDLTIQGAGAGLTIIDSAGGDRVFDIFAPATVTISGVTVRNGGRGENGGGGIRNAGTLSLTNVTVSDNFAFDFPQVAGGTVDVTGGGILNTGTMALTNVTVSGNMAQSGGGIVNLVVIVSKTVDLSGGMVVRQFSAGTLTMTNATVTGNTPSGFVGSECSSGFGCGKSSARLTNTIMVNNFSGANCSGARGVGCRPHPGGRDAGPARGPVRRLTGVSGDPAPVVPVAESA